MAPARVGRALSRISRHPLGRDGHRGRRADRQLLAGAEEKLALEDLYLTDGIYRYAGGWNPRAVLATAFGCALAWGGLVVSQLSALTDYGWFVGAFGAGGLYLALEKLQGARAAKTA